jgi:ketosteroid isomerase-like protein
MPTSTNTQSQTIDEILEIERTIMAAIKAKDAAMLAPFLADEFIYRTHFGAEADRDQFLESIASFPVEILTLRGEELRVDVFGEVAILTGVQVAEARLPDHAPEESAVAFTDVFVQRDGRWLMVLAFGVELPSEPDAISEPGALASEP